jgi:hypothetical protein
VLIIHLYIWVAALGEDLITAEYFEGMKKGVLGSDSFVLKG